MVRGKNVYKLLAVGLSVIIISLMTFSLWKAINKGAGDIMIYFFGVTNTYYQTGIIILFGIIVLTLLGLVSKKINLWTAIKDVLRL